MAKLSPYETGELTDSIFFTLLVLTEPIHGYMIMQRVNELTQGKVIIGPATMYTTLAKMVAAGWIAEQEIDNSKKEYYITTKGREILNNNYKQRVFLLSVAERILGGANNE
ncbi:transcriptional regulator, PadR family [Gemella bergeri ATCC 700627]|uniref:Transcriptional regulator, PadR family n=1 Tax=Gemella bergeri ATCC 700627 TaxID=1321820 RepID=U2QPK3_9BACL|nr:PadR family transcriptional regulator [Gemella bergeri]ERK58416.1 transcriptional regulator, PadR family [Gemella bergeri ATCC 700627]